MKSIAAIHVAECPLPTCPWSSDPLGSEAAAVEALRAHVNGHRHGELVDYVTTDAAAWVHRYDRAARADSAGKEGTP